MSAKRIRFWAWTMLALLLLSACHKDMFDLERLSDEIELDPRLVAPIVYGNLSMDDITALFDSADYVGEFETGLIYVAYRDTLVAVSADTAIEVPDIKTSEFYVDSDSDFDIILPVPVGDTFHTETRFKIVDFSLEGESRLDEVLVKNGNIVIDVQYSFKHRGRLILSSEEIIDNQGNSFSRTIDINTANGDFHEVLEFSSDSFSMLPVVLRDTSFIFMDFDLSLVNSGAPISPGESCSVQATFTEMDFYRIYGFMDASDLVDESSSVEIPLWRDNPDLEAFKLADPRMNITLSSSVGIPFRIDLDSVIAVDREGVELPLLIEGGNSLEFGAPGMHEQGTTVVTVQEINRNTSNIDDFVNSAPVDIIYSVEGHTTTTGDDSTHFVLEDSRLDLSAEVLIPLDFLSTGYALSDTMAFELGENMADTSLVKNAEISIHTVNELPVEVQIQAYFLDAAGMVIDSVFDDNRPILGATTVDPATGLKVGEGKEEINTVEFPAEKLARLANATELLMSGSLITSNDGVPYVKIMSDYTLDFKVSVLADVVINSRAQ